MKEHLKWKHPSDNSGAAYVAKRKRHLVKLGKPKSISAFYKERPTIIKEGFCHNYVSVDSRYNL